MKTKTVNSQPDMQREYRRELRSIQTESRKIARERMRQIRNHERNIERIEREAVKLLRAAKRDFQKLDAGLLKQSAILAKRHDILTGRLS